MQEISDTKIAFWITSIVGLIATLTYYFTTSHTHLWQIGMCFMQIIVAAILMFVALGVSVKAATKKYAKGIWLGIGINLLIGFSVCTLG